MTELPFHVGIDFGARLAGTTALAAVNGQQVQVWQSESGQDADAFILELVRRLSARVLFIDAPLTLPAVYVQGTGASAADFFYRAADKEVQGMSPMFLGGLTARAMKLRAELAPHGIAVLETYPRQLVRLLFPDLQGYKTTAAALPAFSEALQQLLPFPLKEPVRNWHQFDSLLAWYSGYRHLQRQAVLYGEATEGRIIV
ncbi:DUF429 domain-containing protein [Pontibacter liquoris]|uniref:DUF429 domain-containing protein n=1 Tax=Pontibacter liquoris TaxID=2905677 RepID=UPI001FA70FC9|nr:DUF429 domain-containing protein [Pontibacter liquoris]